MDDKRGWGFGEQAMDSEEITKLHQIQNKARRGPKHLQVNKSSSYQSVQKDARGLGAFTEPVMAMAGASPGQRLMFTHVRNGLHDRIGGLSVCPVKSHESRRVEPKGLCRDLRSSFRCC